MSTERFWETKSLTELSEPEWESLCDGCARCCLHKLEDEDTGELHFTRLACRQLDIDHSRCRDYPRRFALVPDCLKLHADDKATLQWLPSSCAYRRVSEGRGLPAWHPLITGDPDSVHRAGRSVRGRAISEDWVPEEDWEDHIIRWVTV